MALALGVLARRPGGGALLPAGVAALFAARVAVFPILGLGLPTRDDCRSIFISDPRSLTRFECASLLSRTFFDVLQSARRVSELFKQLGEDKLGFHVVRFLFHHCSGVCTQSQRSYLRKMKREGIRTVLVAFFGGFEVAGRLMAHPDFAPDSRPVGLATTRAPKAPR